MKDLYFPHDQNAMNDNKIIDLRGSYGMEGYGVFWAIIEALSRENDLSLEYSERKVKGLSVSIQPSFDMMEFVNFCIDIQLFVSDGSRFWSESLRRRIRSVKEVSDKRRTAANARWSKCKSTCNANALQNDTNADASALQTPYTNDAPCIRFAMQNEIENSSSSSARAREGNLDPDPIYDSGWETVVKAYTSQLGSFPHGTAGQTLFTFYEDLGADVMLIAIERTNLAQPDSPYKYLKAILDSFADRGIKTREDAEAYCKDFDRKKERRKVKPVSEPSIPENDANNVRWV